jgi:glycosyltransferase involved in cell wall biosynthesis
VTGRRDRIPDGVLRAAAPNVEFTGFLPDDEYWALLESVDLVVDLTYRDDCLVCGAYEAVARGKPLVLSDTAALRGYFSAGAVYTANTAEDIERALQQALTRLDDLISEVRQFRTNVGTAWAGVGETFRDIVFGTAAAPISGEH